MLYILKKHSTGKVFILLTCACITLSDSWTRGVSDHASYYAWPGFSHLNGRLGFLVSYVFSCPILQASWGEFIQGANCRFLLYALVWRYCFDWNCSCWWDDTLFGSIICKNYIPQQLIDIHDGQQHSLVILLLTVDTSCLHSF